jgi:hypothetical protein
MTDDALERGRAAASARDWQAAHEHLTDADAEHGLGPEDLERLAKASWWTGRSNESIEARERAYAAYAERGDTERAAFCALTLRREYSCVLRTAPG